MREAEEGRQWGALIKARRARDARPIQLGDRAEFDLAQPCTIMGGRNGAGKSRVLRLLAEVLAADAVLIDLHHLCEQALMVLRSREDFGEMAEEFGVVGPDEDRLEDVQRIVGREYDSVDWYALEVEPADADVAERFCWGGEQSLVPYFDVKYKGQAYSSREMGLGEFSMHFMFWILDQYRDRDGLTLLLDEPDAYLPPVGASALLARLLRLCRARNWSVVISTHSEELIRQAVRRDAFVLLQPGAGGEILATHSSVDATAAEQLLARPAVRLVIFCEDETALHFLRSLLDSADRTLSLASFLLWGDGEGYLRTLHGKVPRIARSEIAFCFMFDGDQRRSLPEPDEEHWPALSLPTERDPDTLFKQLAGLPGGLAAKLGVPERALVRTLERLEGKDPHDWVNDLAAEYGRQRVLSALADLWCEEHPELVSRFVEELKILRFD